MYYTHKLRTMINLWFTDFVMREYILPNQNDKFAQLVQVLSLKQIRGHIYFFVGSKIPFLIFVH